MRGVLALAAAFSLPDTLDSGAPFPQRNIIIFLSFCVIFVTLVMQGLTLPMIIRKLGLSEATARNLEEQEARRTILKTVLNYIQELQSKSKDEHVEIYTDFAKHYRDRLTLLDSAGDKQKQHQQELVLVRYRRVLSQELRALERTTALNLRNEDKINDEVLRTIERELDLIEARFQES
jgi:monovalent cation/hydrogen antiporter